MQNFIEYDTQLDLEIIVSIILSIIVEYLSTIIIFDIYSTYPSLHKSDR